MPDYFINRMKSEDVLVVHAIEQSTTPNPWTQFIFQSCLERYDCWVMILGHSIIAFGILMNAGDESHILNLAVAKEYQQQGYGKKMLEHLLHEARLFKAVRILLEVRISNDPALNLYKKMGFKPIGLRKQYYQTQEGREDAQVLCKEL